MICEVWGWMAKGADCVTCGGRGVVEMDASMGDNETRR